MLVYVPRSIRLAFKLVKYENLPAEFETLTVKDIELGVLDGDFELVNEAGDYDPECSHHVVHVRTKTTVAYVESAYELDGEEEPSWRRRESPYTKGRI